VTLHLTAHVFAPLVNTPTRHIAQRGACPTRRRVQIGSQRLRDHRQSEQHPISRVGLTFSFNLLLKHFISLEKKRLRLDLNLMQDGAILRHLKVNE
jgi:hypothetical protein